MNQTIKKNGYLRFAAVLCLVALWVAAPFALNGDVAQAESMSDTRIGASLTGAPINGVTPAGYSEYRIDDSGRRRLDVQGSSLNLPAGTSLTITVNNSVVGTMGVSSFGTAYFRVDTGDGQSVPVINAGMPIRVLNAGTVVLAGTFGSVTPTPSPSGSPFPSPSGSPTGSPNPSPSGSPTGTPTGSPNPTPSGSPTGTPTGSPNPSPSPSGTPSAGGLFAGLSGATIGGVVPSGYAGFEIHSSRTELEVRVSQVNLPGGTVLPVLVNGTTVGSVFISGGEGRLRLRSDEGQNVPQVVDGSTIVLRNGGTAVLSGVFTAFTGPSPSPSGTPTGTPNPSPSPTPTASPAFGRAFESNMVREQSPANGEIRITLNASETIATISGAFNNLGTGQTGARIESSVGDSSVVLDLSTIGGTSGTFTPRTMAVTPAQVQQLRTGLWSAVITSAGNPAGEIRGPVRLRSNASDFDGDGFTDVAVFRPSEGVWYMQNSAGFRSQVFGTANDKVVSADYDGDGRTDTAVFRNADGQGIWDVKRSSDGGTSSEHFGFASDLPAHGDFDGDGRGDLAVYRPSSGVWYVKNSNNTGYTIVQFGAAEDVPIPADMDGDGRDDIAVFRPSTGNWYWIRSSDGQVGAQHWGQTGDIPSRGDFDGDGKSDLTVYRPSNGTWYTHRSADGGLQGGRFGLSDDVPVAGNFDEDRKVDIAVFRPSEGVWYVLRSSDGMFVSHRFGVNGDIPVNAR